MSTFSGKAVLVTGTGFSEASSGFKKLFVAGDFFAKKSPATKSFLKPELASEKL